MGLHSKTPRLSVVDPRGLSIRSVDYWRAIENQPAEARINRTVHDGAGRAVKQWDPRLWALQVGDPLAPANLTTVYSLPGNVLRTDSVDAGTQINLHGLADEVVLGWDSRETRREVEYDDSLRAVAVFEQGASEPRHCVERFTYGRPGLGDPTRNQYGQLIRHDDPAGTMLFPSFAITDNSLEQIRHFTLDPVTPDWPESIDDRQRLLEPGTGAISRWRFGPLGDVLEQIDAKGNRQAFGLTIDGRLRESRLQLKDQPTGQTLVSEIRYNAQGQVEGEVAGNGVRTTLAYRPEDGRLICRRAEDASGGVLQHLIYGYDRMGNVLSIEDQALPIRYFANRRIDPISRFRYDSLYQLIEAFGWEAGGANQGPDSIGRIDPSAVSNYRQAYTYDKGGNLLKLTHVGAQNHGRDLTAARYSNRCLPWRNGVPPAEEDIGAAFDAKGNLLELDQGRFLTWDLRNQLQSVSPVERVSGLNDRESYAYDGGGQRVRKIRSLNTNARTVVAETRYLPGLELRTHSGTGENLQVITAQGGLNNVRLLRWESPPPGGINDRYRYNHTDHLGSIGLELTADAQIISREAFYPFGESAWLDGDPVAVSYKTVGYSGKERDVTGLYYYGLRYYIPWFQRWCSADPSGYADGSNLYRMVHNNPVNFMDDEGAVTRKKLANGLWAPVLAVGKERDVQGAVPIDAGKAHQMVPFTAKPTDLRKALSVPQFSREMVNTDLFMSTKVRYSSSVASQMNNSGGASFIFSMQHISYSGSAKGEFNALKIVDIAAGEIPDQSSAVSGYWAPQGGYVDIPLHPKGTDPEYVFTPGFSGCSLTVDQLNDNVLRVRHVEGSKEEAQYNQLPAAEHGMGMSAAMEFMDYGFDNEGTQVVTELTGFAFMKYDRKTRVWNIHYQSLQGAPTIGKFSTERKLFGGSKSFTNVMEKPKVRKTMSKQVGTAVKPSVR
ncbi:RHS repeat protein [Pseudomonas frederiksbergensis]|uniref:RHS repeat domain-containing protein n=1 Tax=Pseudomonas frederiksbergensis TaxID=104087 RepID=UPI00197F7323|nr:RHS repeat protein [Pseudomonas frederiksbergensis]MBN3864913.1 RHS repeat protein [Pseudomonas frederiksbergensis]